MRLRVPRVLREWKPKRKREDDAPGASPEYWEMETAKAWGYGWREWRMLPMLTRAKLQAHEIEKGLREGYAAERMEERVKKEGSGGGGGKSNPLQAMRSAWSG